MNEEEKAIEILKEFKKTGYHTLRLKYNEDRIHTNKLIERALETLLALYQKEKEKNKEYEKHILQDTSYSMITRLEMKLKYDIEQINKKLTSDEYINDYRVARLKGIRTKCKELLELLEERN